MRSRSRTCGRKTLEEEPEPAEPQPEPQAGTAGSLGVLIARAQSAFSPSGKASAFLWAARPWVSVHVDTSAASAASAASALSSLERGGHGTAQRERLSIEVEHFASETYKFQFKETTRRAPNSTAIRPHAQSFFSETVLLSRWLLLCGWDAEAVRLCCGVDV